MLLERLEDGREHDGDDFERRRGNGHLGDQDAGMKIMLCDVLREVSHLFDPDSSFGTKFYPDCPDGGGCGVGVGSGGGGSVFFQHGGCGACREGQLFATKRRRKRG